LEDELKALMKPQYVDHIPKKKLNLELLKKY